MATPRVTQGPAAASSELRRLDRPSPRRSAPSLVTMEPDPKRQKTPSTLVTEWIERHESNATLSTLWFVVTEKDGTVTRVPTRRDCVTYFSKLIRDLPDQTDPEFILIGEYDAETVVTFAQACLPRVSTLPTLKFIQLCKVVQLAHYLDAPDLVKYWWRLIEKMKGYPLTGEVFMAYFDAMRDVGKPCVLKDTAILNFPTVYTLNFSEAQKKKYETQAHQIFRQCFDLCDRDLYQHKGFLRELTICLLHCGCPEKVRLWTLSS